MPPAAYEPSDWMPPSVRAVIWATRPWSIPASLVPTALAAALVFDPSRGTLPALLDGAAAAACGICVHLGANCANTYFDFASGLDRPESADDRALVERRVSPGTVAALAAGFYAAGGALGAYHALALGLDARMLALLAAGVLLSFFYTARPFALKHRALGDAVVFVCFGPLLFAATAAAAARDAARAADPVVLLMSVPVGLLTVNILHANNARDARADAAAGATTLAQLLGARGSRALFVANIAAAYATAAAALAAALAQRADSTPAALLSSLAVNVVKRVGRGGAATLGGALPLLQLWSSPGPAAVPPPGDLHFALHWARAAAMLVVATLPWAVALCRRFARRELATLPQAAAQFQLLFGACLFCGLLPAEELARLLLGCLFYLGGVQNVLMARHTSALVNRKLSLALAPGGAEAPLPLALTDALAAGASLAQLGASVLFVLGIHAREAAAVLVLFLLPVTAAVHDLWNADIDLGAEKVAVADADAGANAGADGEGEPRRAAAAASAKGKGAKQRRGSSAAVAAAADAPAPAAKAAKAAPVSAPALTAAIVPSGGGVPTFLTNFDNEFVHFFKNVGMLGGLLVYLAFAP